MKILAILILVMCLSCIPTIPTEPKIDYNYYVIMMNSDGLVLQEFFANMFEVYSGVLCFDKTSLDKNKHCFAKSDNIMIEVIKIAK